MAFGVLSIGSTVAGYRIERVLGAGGMGTVYLVQNPELPRRDAVKVLSGELSRSPEFRARFIREAEVASGLAHPNIVAVYSRGETEDGQLWIAMQFVEGTNADDALRAGTMTPARAVHIIGEIGKGLDYAHRHNVVHRDIKPGNFLLSGAVGDSERALLGDFGIARALDDIGLTATGSLIATMAYAAPEVLAGTPIDGRADLYSLGCTLFRLLTGKTPFPNANGPVAVMMAHLHQPPPRVTDRVPGLPPALDAVIATAMAKDPAQRFQTAGDLAAAAGDALRGGGTSATAPWTVVPSGEVSSYPRQTEPWWQSPTGERTMMSPAGQPTQLRPVQLPAPQPPVTRRPRRLWIAGALAAIVLLVGGTVAALNMGGGSAPSAGDETQTPTTAPSTTQSAPPTVPVSALPGLLPSVDELKPMLGGGNLVVDATSPLATTTNAAVTERECIGVWMPGQNVVYDGSGYSGMQLQSISDHDDPRKLNQLTLSVAAFLTAEQASQFVETQSRQWAQCANRSITFTYPERAPAHMELGAPSTTNDGILTVTQRLDFTPPDQHCEHALAVRDNVVIDVQSCSTTPGEKAGTIVRDIAAKIDQQQ
jgi:eukaryotic-like serine/threonine-protein kinase